MPSHTIVFIHGLFLNNRAWDQWIPYFENLGYKCHAPAYRYHSGSPDSLRSNIDPGLGKVGLQDVVDDMGRFIDSLPEKPILIGHSMGGLIAQRLMDMGKAAAVVAIDGAPPKGVFSFKWSVLKTGFPVLNPLKGDKPFLPSLEWFRYGFANAMTLEESEKAYRHFVVPEGRNILRNAIGKGGVVDFKKPHPPLLLIAGGNDHLVPASINQKNFEVYTDKNSQIDFKLFPDRTHSTCTEPKWEEVAGHIAQWLVTQQSAARQSSL